GCANDPRSAADCGRHYVGGGSGLLGLLAAAGAFDRAAGPDCAYSAPLAASNASVPLIVEEPDTAIGAPQFGQSVINSGDCIGAVVNGDCHGTPAPGAPTSTCYGQMINGICTGPMF